MTKNEWAVGMRLAVFGLIVILLILGMLLSEKGRAGTVSCIDIGETVRVYAQEIEADHESRLC